MHSVKTRRRAVLVTASILVMAAPIPVIAGLTAQGLTAQGLTAQGLTAQGLTAQGLTAQGLTAQGLTAQGLTAQGLTAQGLTAQGLTAQGLTAQGLTAQGVALMGTDALTPDLKGVIMSHVEIRGPTSTSAVQPHVLTNIPNMSAGPGNYIHVLGVGGGSAVGHYAVAHLVDGAGNPAEDLDLYIAAEQKDPMPNLFHNTSEQDNQDELYVVYVFHKWSGQWMSLCPYNAATLSASAMAIPEAVSVDPNKFIFACTATGVASKCARNWGYRPWAETQAWQYDATANGGLGAWSLQSVPLGDLYGACKTAAMAAYCQDGRSYTKQDTLVDAFDTRQAVWPNWVENPFNQSNPDSLWMMAQEYFSSTGASPYQPSLKDSALQRTRYRELAPGSECGNFAYIDRLEHDHIEDGRWAAPLTNTPRIQVFSPTHCTHNEYEPGAALPWDCSPCTTKVCQSMPECCGAGAAPGWTAACIAQADSVCETGGVQWPKGAVWPRDLPAAAASPILPKFLTGPHGAVLRVDGHSSSATAATISGWACDPEWPGATVGVRIYGGAPREQMGSTLLGEVRADQALAAPLAREVALACDGPTRPYSRHAFSFTLPADHSGNVFVYAIDETTEDGPPAPPTLIRNGVVPVPRCAHSEHVVGEALDAACSTCATSICNDETHATCCSSAWTESCVDAASACAPASSSSPLDSSSYTAVATGSIEAPSDGSYVFDASQQPSRLFINGTKVLDWFETSPGTTQGSITLTAGHRYHLRWDRFQAEPAMGTPGPGLTWQPPGAVGQLPIPSTQLYMLAPGTATGLTATYFTAPGFGGLSLTPAKPDPFVDINTDVAPPSAPKMDLPPGFGPSYSAVWEGDLVPTFTEAHNFYVVGSGVATLYINGTAVTFTPPPASSAPGGCAHDLCSLGGKLNPTCNSCVDAICAVDPYCCNGGYLSYYSTEPEWDARCIAEVEAYCAPAKCTTPLPTPGSPQKKSDPVALQAGVHYTLRLEYSNPTTDKTMSLMWSSARVAKQVIPQFALYPKLTTPAGLGTGLNVTLFANKVSASETLVPDLDTVVAAGSVTDLSLTPPFSPSGTPIVDLLRHDPTPPPADRCRRC